MIFIEGMIFLEKFGEKQLSDELRSEQKFIINSFQKLLSILDKITLYENAESTKSQPASVHNETESVDVNGKVENNLTQRKPETKPAKKSFDNYLILEQNQTCFIMHSNLPSYRYIRLCVSVNNAVRGKYYCVLEREFILLGQGLNGLPPEFVISLENYEIKKEKRVVIKLDNNGLEVALQFDEESERNFWFESIRNAQASVYSYVPIRFQETENCSSPKSSSHLPPVILKRPELPSKISDLKKNNLQIGEIANCHSLPCQLDKAIEIEESNYDQLEFENIPNTSGLIKPFGYKIPTSLTSLNTSPQKRPIRPLQTFPLTNILSNKQQDVTEDDVLVNPRDQTNLQAKYQNLKPWAGSDDSSIECHTSKPLMYKDFDVPQAKLSDGSTGYPLKEKTKKMVKLTRIKVNDFDSETRKGGDNTGIRSPRQKKGQKPTIVYIPNL